MHIDRKRPSTHGLGKYSELIATAAFVSEGATVAMPFGGQKGWDLLVESDEGKWLRVQVKTARRVKGQVIVDLQTQRGRVYAECDADMIVAVLPETGDIWRFGINETCGKKIIGLARRPLWIVGSAHVEPSKGGRTAGSKGFLTNGLREIIRTTQAGISKPENVTGLNWLITMEWACGQKIRTLSDAHGLSMETIRDRITRTVKPLIEST